MTTESLQRAIWFVSEKRKYDVVSAASCRQNGYHAIASQHENEAALADLILKDLYAEQKTTDEARNS